jgi:uncharacterized protein YndB with AHSA1/START domain
MAESKFVYVTYIRTTPEKLWQALLEPEFTRQYWLGVPLESTWKVGSPWKMIFPDGRVGDAGEVVECVPHKRLVLSWRHESNPELKAEGFTRMTCDIQQHETMCKLTIVHEMAKPESKMIQAVSNGWPIVLSGLKSLLETGNSLEAMRTLPRETCPGAKVPGRMPHQ